MNNRKRKLFGLFLPLILLLSACASDAPQDTLEPEGPIARKIDNLVNPVFIVAGVVFVIVEFGVVLLLWKFRRRKDEDEDFAPAQIHGATKLELGWTILPAILLLVIGLATLSTLFAVDAEADDAKMTVEVVGQQWWWEYRYDTDNDGKFDDVITANDLVVPAGEKIRLAVTSEDVIHSFWIPKLNGKKDAVPNRTSELTVETEEPGTYVGQCTEYCGLSHAYMRQRLVSLSAGDYDRWLANQLEDAEEPTDEEAAAGAEMFATQCSRCHLVRGVNDEEYEEQGSGDDLVSGHAPDLTHLMTRGAFAGAMFELWEDQNGNEIVDWDEIGAQLNRYDLEQWLADPSAQKPMAPVPEGAGGRGMPNLGLTQDQIDQLVAFLETLE